MPSQRHLHCHAPFLLATQTPPNGICTLPVQGFFALMVKIKSFMLLSQNTICSLKCGRRISLSLLCRESSTPGRLSSTTMSRWVAMSSILGGGTFLFLAVKEWMVHVHCFRVSSLVWNEGWGLHTSFPLSSNMQSSVDHLVTHGL